MDISPEAVAKKLPGIAVSECADIEAEGVLENFAHRHGPFDLVLEATATISP